MLLHIVENEVACAIDNIKTNSATGPHGIPPKFIKLTEVILIPVLTKLYHKCFKEECVPDDFQLSHVIPIPKTAVPKEPGDFIAQLLQFYCTNVHEREFKACLNSKRHQYFSE